jgi:hypothetical protein
MTFLERIFLSRATKLEIESLRCNAKVLVMECRHLESSNEILERWHVRAGEMRKALNEIADQETPGANATVKRMARIAREAAK